LFRPFRGNLNRSELSAAQIQTLIEQVLAGDRLALARTLTQVENDTPAGREALSMLFPHTGHAHLIGVTGSPGTGKSSLVNQLARYYRHPNGEQKARRVAVVAVDPSSPFTGGAVLGDRVRMRDLAGDPGVFIRSMSSRGALGGLAQTTAGVVQVFDAAGFDVVLIETVGAGQSEVDIAKLAHTTLVVEAPGLGDDIQAIKAGILEVADILVINKADRPGVENTLRALRMMLELAHPSPRLYQDYNCPPSAAGGEQFSNPPAGPEALLWKPPVLTTVAMASTGVETLYEAVQQHYAYLQQSGEWQQREQARIAAELSLLVQNTLMARWRQSITEEQYRSILVDLLQRRLAPFQAVEALLGPYKG
jgi:LAO/AO transport system kinase